MDRLGTMDKNRTTYPSEKILHRIGDTGRSRFQYRQVSSLMSALMRRENVFSPKTAFEVLLLSGFKNKVALEII